MAELERYMDVFTACFGKASPSAYGVYVAENSHRPIDSFAHQNVCFKQSFNNKP